VLILGWRVGVEGGDSAADGGGDSCAFQSVHPECPPRSWLAGFTSGRAGNMWQPFQKLPFSNGKIKIILGSIPKKHFTTQIGIRGFGGFF